MRKKILSTCLLACMSLLPTMAQSVITVTTDTRYARGATMIFGRMKYSGVTAANIKEQGFCYGTNPQPTVNDGKTTEYLSNNGLIFKIKDLQPATKYYVRGYLTTKDGITTYGEPIKVYTIPKGQITWSYDDAGDEATNKRIRSAVQGAVDYWNNLTSIKGFGTSVHYSPGTPTADCSYGGWMRVGANQSYQRIGTIMHEMLHGIGVGTQSVWWNSTMRSNGDRGYWQGDRVTALLRFWDNNTTEMLNGDKMHLWPYGINGAHEDNGSDLLYCATSLIAQAVGEDGLPPAGGFATPAYVFDQEDSIKYYIKNESPEYGLNTAYLLPGNNGELTWGTVSNTEGVPNDSAAWNISFDPSTGLYSFKNVATGTYLSYTSGMRLVNTESIGTNEKFHMMRSRTDVTVGTGTSKFTTRGFWIIHNNGSYASPSLTAATNGKVGVSGFNIEGKNPEQRWVIETIDGIQKIENAMAKVYKSDFDLMLQNVKNVVAVNHIEDSLGIDERTNKELQTIETKAEGNLSAGEIAQLKEDVRTILINFLRNTTVSNTDNPYDISFLIQNADLTALDGWTCTNGTPVLNTKCVGIYNTEFNFNQVLEKMPAGSYKLTANAMQRPGSIETVYTAFSSGRNTVNAWIFAGSKANKVANIIEGARKTKLGGSENALSTDPVTYVPADQIAAFRYFDRGQYPSYVFSQVTKDYFPLKIGIRCTAANTDYWTAFNMFKLYFYGNVTLDALTGLNNIITDQQEKLPVNIYSIDGRLIKKGVESLKDLQKGIYIVNGKKVAVM